MSACAPVESPLATPPAIGVDPNDHLRLLYKLASLVWRRGRERGHVHVEPHDLAADVYPAFASACRNYDPARGKFGSYAGKPLVKAMWRALWSRRNRPLPQLPVDGEGRELDPQAPDAHDGTAAWEAGHDAAAVLTGPLDELPGREREIVYAAFGLGGREKKSQGEIAAELGLTHQRVNQLLHRALRLLRAAAGADDAPEGPALEEVGEDPDEVCATAAELEAGGGSPWEQVKAGLCL